MCLLRRRALRPRRRARLCSGKLDNPAVSTVCRRSSNACQAGIQDAPPGRSVVESGQAASWANGARSHAGCRVSRAHHMSDAPCESPNV